MCLIGIFAPTSGGQAAVNESFRREVRLTGAAVRVIDLSPRGGPATLARRLSRLPKVFVGAVQLVQLLGRQIVKSTYIGISGGYGQIYDLLFIGIVRLAGVSLYIHHDSFAYLGRARLLTSAVIKLAGSRATHIVLCAAMAERLQELYPSARRTVVISNVTNTYEPKSPPRMRVQLNSIGLFSNLTRAKGVLEFLDVADQVCAVRPELRALLAGPVEEPALESILRERLRSGSPVEYVGPIYGDAKDRFLRELDVLILPTNYVHEAEPKVIAEALAYGLVVIARERGCIGSLLSAGRGVAIPDSLDFVSTAKGLLLEWSLSNEAFASLSDSALRSYQDLRGEQSGGLNELISEMAGTTTIDSP